jgi:hypothetical protein
MFWLLNVLNVMSKKIEIKKFNEIIVAEENGFLTSYQPSMALTNRQHPGHKLFSSGNLPSAGYYVNYYVSNPSYELVNFSQSESSNLTAFNGF